MTITMNDIRRKCVSKPAEQLFATRDSKAKQKLKESNAAAKAAALARMPVQQKVTTCPHDSSSSEKT